jgi:chemotaxis protein MotA
MIGPSMAIGLVATFYGLILSNLVFQPIAENLAQTTRKKQVKNTIIVEGIGLILEKTNPIILAEELNSFLLPSERVDWHTRREFSAGKAA